MITIELDDWEVCHMSGKINGEAMQYLEHKIMGNLREHELVKCDKVCALADKLAKAAENR